MAVIEQVRLDVSGRRFCGMQSLAGNESGQSNGNESVCGFHTPDSTASGVGRCSSTELHERPRARFSGAAGKPMQTTARRSLKSVRNWRNSAIEPLPGGQGVSQFRQVSRG